MALIQTVSAGDNEALLVNRMGRWRVSFGKVIALGRAHRVERFDLSPRVLTVTRSGARAVVLRGGARMDLQATVTVAPSRSPHDLLRLARAIGTGDPAALDRLVTPRIEHALGAAAGSVTPEDLSRVPDMLTQLVRSFVERSIYNVDVTAVEVSEVHREAPPAQGPFR